MDITQQTAIIYSDLEAVMKKKKIFTMSVGSVYPLYLAKAEKKERTKAEVDEIFRWLTGYTQHDLEAHWEAETDFETFFTKAPKMNPRRKFLPLLQKQPIFPQNFPDQSNAKPNQLFCERSPWCQLH